MLRLRVITATLLLILLLVALFWLPAWGWFGLVVIVASLGAWEWAGLSGLGGAGRIGYGVACGVLCLGLGLWTGLIEGGITRSLPLLVAYLTGVVFWSIGAPLWLRRQWRLSGQPAAWLVGLVVLIPAALALAQLRELGPWVLLFVLSLVWVADIAAYFSGRRFGRHKLAPAVSPGKTWEGAIGAALGVTLFGASVLASGILPIVVSPVWAVLPALLVLTAVSIVGDLFESLMKRQSGIKDSSQLLPGHGGILDRIDSLTSTLPFAGLVMLLA